LFEAIPTVLLCAIVNFIVSISSGWFTDIYYLVLWTLQSKRVDCFVWFYLIYYDVLSTYVVLLNHFLYLKGETETCHLHLAMMYIKVSYCPLCCVSDNYVFSSTYNTISFWLYAHAVEKREIVHSCLLLVGLLPS
jgi:hypothetical protein